MRHLYAVRDVKANDVGDQVMVCKADPVAIRAFTDALASKNPQSLMARYPEDYELLHIGTMTDEGAILLDDVFPRVVITGAAWKASTEAASAGV